METDHWRNDDELESMVGGWGDSQHLNDAVNLVERGVAECEANGWTAADLAAHERILEVLEPLRHVVDEELKTSDG